MLLLLWLCEVRAWEWVCCNVCMQGQRSVSRLINLTCGVCACLHGSHIVYTRWPISLSFHVNFLSIFLSICLSCVERAFIWKPSISLPLCEANKTHFCDFYRCWFVRFFCSSNSQCIGSFALIRWLELINNILSSRWLPLRPSPPSLSAEHNRQHCYITTKRVCVCVYMRWQL